MKPANPPTKHHYIPAFYLKRWEIGGKVTEFTRPWKTIVAKQVSAEATGFEDRLYELEGYEPALAQQVEEKFFKAIDTWAHDALVLLEKHGHDGNWNSESRSAWSRFILSLLLRTPEDIRMFREWWRDDFGRTDEDAEARYRAARDDGDPETFAEFLENQPLSIKERYQYKVLFSLIDHENIGGEMNDMHWRLLQTPTQPTLLTSDRPIVRTSSVRGPKAHLALPIGPRLLFVASPDTQFLRQVLRADQVRLVKEVNRQVVEGATRFVYGIDGSQRRFIENRFGKAPQPRLMENLIAMRTAAQL